MIFLLQGVGKIIEVGKAVSPELKGKVVGYVYNGSFAEYTVSLAELPNSPVKMKCL